MDNTNSKIWIRGIILEKKFYIIRLCISCYSSTISSYSTHSLLYTFAPAFLFLFAGNPFPPRCRMSWHAPARPPLFVQPTPSSVDVLWQGRVRCVPLRRIANYLTLLSDSLPRWFGLHLFSSRIRQKNVEVKWFKQIRNVCRCLETVSEYI